MSISIDGFLREIQEMQDRLRDVTIANNRLRDQVCGNDLLISKLNNQIAACVPPEQYQNLLNEKNSLAIRVEQLNSAMKAYQAGSNRSALIVSELQTKLANAQATANRQRANAQRRAQRQQKYIDGLRAANAELQRVLLAAIQGGGQTITWAVLDKANTDAADKLLKIQRAAAGKPPTPNP